MDSSALFATFFMFSCDGFLRNLPSCLNGPLKIPLQFLILRQKSIDLILLHSGRNSFLACFIIALFSILLFWKYAGTENKLCDVPFLRTSRIYASGFATYCSYSFVTAAFTSAALYPAALPIIILTDLSLLSTSSVN